MSEPFVAMLLAIAQRYMDQNEVTSVTPEVINEVMTAAGQDVTSASKAISVLVATYGS